MADLRETRRDRDKISSPKSVRMGEAWVTIFTGESEENAPLSDMGKRTFTGEDGLLHIKFMPDFLETREEHIDTSNQRSKLVLVWDADRDAKENGFLRLLDKIAKSFSKD